MAILFPTGTATEAVVRLDEAELAGGLNLSLIAALTPGGTPAILPFAYPCRH